MSERPRASRIEILGAWLHLWTPPRDVVVPPVPWRKVALGAAGLALLGVFAALVSAPAIDAAKDEGAARRARLRAEQRAMTGALPRAVPIATVERLIGRDAKARFGADGRDARCEPAPGADPGAARAVYDCHVVVREIRGAGEQEGATGA